MNCPYDVFKLLARLKGFLERIFCCLTSERGFFFISLSRSLCWPSFACLLIALLYSVSAFFYKAPSHDFWLVLKKTVFQSLGKCFNVATDFNVVAEGLLQLTEANRRYILWI